MNRNEEVSKYSRSVSDLREHPLRGTDVIGLVGWEASSRDPLETTSELGRERQMRVQTDNDVQEEPDCLDEVRNEEVGEQDEVL